MSPDTGLSSNDQKPATHFPPSKRILVVDDHENIRLFLSEWLGRLGFLVCSASQGVEGLACLRKYPICGILLDLEMPVMDGLTMLGHLRKEFNAIPVIVMSADPTLTTMIKAIEAGAKDYVFKPISYEILQYKCLRLFE